MLRHARQRTGLDARLNIVATRSGRPLPPRYPPNPRSGLNVYSRGLHPLLCAGSRDARVQMTVRGAPNGHNCCVIVIACRALQTGRKVRTFQRQPFVRALGRSPHQQSCPCILSIVISTSRTLSDVCLNRQPAEAL
jgi:hypothetical protein